jgi:16S rRNA processing protein RimM
VIDYFLIARIISIYGKNGFLKITSFSDFPDRFFNLRKVFIDFFDDRKEFLVEKVEIAKGFFTIKLKNFDNDTDAQVLVGKDIFVSSEDAVKLPENYYFIHDLLGSRVYRNDMEFGKIKDVLNYPANDVLVIENLEGSEILIPAIADYIESFNPENKILILRPGDELYEDED